MSGSNQNLVSNLVFWNVDRTFGCRTSRKFIWNWSIRQTNQHGNLIDHKLHYNYPILPKNGPKISIFHFNQNLTNCFIARIYSEFSKFCENFAKIKKFTRRGTVHTRQDILRVGFHHLKRFLSRARQDIFFSAPPLISMGFLLNTFP